MMRKHLKLFLGLATITALLGGVLLARAEGSPVNDLVKKALASYLENNPDSLVAQNLAEVLHAEVVGSGNQVGVLQNQKDESPFYKIALRDSNGSRAIVSGWEEIDLPSTTTTVAEQNQLGKDVFIDYCEIEIKGNVSSTFNTYLGVVSSSAWLGSVAYDAGSGPRPDNLIDGTEFVTSTANVEYASGYRNIRNCFEDQGTLGEQTVRMATSSYFVGFMQSDHGGSCGSTTGAASCEQVTSTNRGFTGKIRYRYHYLSDL